MIPDREGASCFTWIPDREGWYWLKVLPTSSMFIMFGPYWNPRYLCETEEHGLRIMHTGYHVSEIDGAEWGPRIPAPDELIEVHGDLRGENNKITEMTLADEMAMASHLRKRAKEFASWVEP